MKPVSNSLVLSLKMLARITALVLFSLGKCASECEPGALGRNENSAKIIDMDSSVPFKIRLADDWQKDKEMSTFIVRNRKWGPMKEFETYLTNPKREGVVIDVGGNIGVQTCHSAALGYRVFAFEPMPTLQKSLAFNVNNNCLGTKVTLVKIALSTQNSTLNMAYDSSDIGHTMVDKKSKGNGAIRTHRLDTYKPLMNEKIALMKVDVEGFECDVFGGAEGLLKSINAPPVILFECFPGFLRHFGCSVVQLFQMLDEYGYDLYAYNEKNQNLEGAAEYEREILPNERITPDMFASYEEKIYVYREIRGEKRGATTATKDASSNNSSFAQFFKSRGQADIDVMVQSLEAYHSIVKSSIAEGQPSFEGFSSSQNLQVEVYMRAGHTSWVKEMVETGFNGGHSAMTILFGGQDSHLTSFDFMNKQFQQVAKSLNEQLYGTHRLTIVPGDTTQTIPPYVEKIKSDSSHYAQLIAIDGGHSFEVAYADLQNIMPVTACDNILLMDDIFQDDNHRKDWGVWHVDGARDAWRKAIENGMVKQYGCYEFLEKVKDLWLDPAVWHGNEWPRAFCIGTYLKKSPQCPTEISDTTDMRILEILRSVNLKPCDKNTCNS